MCSSDLDADAGDGQALSGATPGTRRRRGPGRHPRQHPQPEMALGVVLPQRPHMSELAARAHAAGDPRLRDDSRIDASEAIGPFTAVLEAGRRRLPGLSGRAPLAANSRAFARTLAARPDLHTIERVPSRFYTLPIVVASVPRFFAGDSHGRAGVDFAVPSYTTT